MLQRIWEFIRFLKYNTHPARMEFKARKAVLFGANKAFELFRDKTFRKLMRFDEKDEEERNRIFNELTVTNLILLVLLLDQTIREIEDEDRKEYVRALRDAAPEYFRDFIHRIGIPEQHASLWGSLVDMRYDEYINDIWEVRREFFAQDDPKLNEYAMANRMMIFQAIAFGLYQHIVRGKVKKDDPLYHYLQTYLLQVYKGYLKKI